MIPCHQETGFDAWPLHQYQQQSNNNSNYNNSVHSLEKKVCCVIPLNDCHSPVPIINEIVPNPFDQKKTTNHIEASLTPIKSFLLLSVDRLWFISSKYFLCDQFQKLGCFWNGNSWFRTNVCKWGEYFCTIFFSSSFFCILYWRMMIIDVWLYPINGCF